MQISTAWTRRSLSSRPFSLKPRRRTASIVPLALIPELRRYKKDTVRCGTLVVKVPEHHQEQRTQTLILFQMGPMPPPYPPLNTNHRGTQSCHSWQLVMQMSTAWTRRSLSSRPFSLKPISKNIFVEIFFFFRLKIMNWRWFLRWAFCYWCISLWVAIKKGVFLMFPVKRHPACCAFA